MSTQVKFAPFGIGIHSMDSEEAKKVVNIAKEKGMSFFKKVADISVNAAAISVGLSLIAGEVALRKTADGLNVASEAIADMHAGYCKKVSTTPYLAVSMLQAGVSLPFNVKK